VLPDQLSGLGRAKGKRGNQQGRSRISVFSAGPFPPSQAGLAAQITQRQHETAAIQDLAARAGTGKNRYHGGMNNTTWQSTVNMLVRYRQITRKLALQSIYTNQFNPFTH
jgi:hypothetical protein